MKVTDLLGNRFRLRKSVPVHYGTPNSQEVETWEAGRLTPTIYSWVEDQGDIWYQFDLVNKQVYIKHDPDSLKPVAERGAAEHLESENPQSNSLDVAFSTFGNFLDLFNIGNLRKVGLLLVSIIAFIIGWKIYGFMK